VLCVALLLRARRKARQGRAVTALAETLTPELQARERQLRHRLRGSRGMM
jgi:hypothetical protein